MSDDSEAWKRQWDATRRVELEAADEEFEAWKRECEVGLRTIDEFSEGTTYLREASAAAAATLGSTSASAEVVSFMAFLFLLAGFFYHPLWVITLLVGAWAVRLWRRVGRAARILTDARAIQESRFRQSKLERELGMVPDDHNDYLFWEEMLR